MKIFCERKSANIAKIENNLERKENLEMENRKLKQFEKYLDNIHLLRRTITEKEILHIKHILNNNGKEFEYLLSQYNFNGYELTNEQTEKGIEYLRKRYISTVYRFVRNTKMTDRVSMMFKFFVKGNIFDFTFVGFAKISNGFVTRYEPIYQMWEKDNPNLNFMYFHFCGKDYELIPVESENGIVDYSLFENSAMLENIWYFVGVIA